MQREAKEKARASAIYDLRTQQGALAAHVRDRCGAREAWRKVRSEPFPHAAVRGDWPRNARVPYEDVVRPPRTPHPSKGKGVVRRDLPWRREIVELRIVAGIVRVAYPAAEDTSEGFARDVIGAERLVFKPPTDQGYGEPATHPGPPLSMHIATEDCTAVQA